MMDKENLKETDIWNLYSAGESRHNSANYYSRVDECWRFYEGDQWHGLKTNGRVVPSENFIKPIVDYKVSAVCMQNMVGTYNPIGVASELDKEICQIISDYADRIWKRNRTDILTYFTVKSAAVSGDGFWYFGEKDCKAQDIDAACVYLADEQNADIQSQEYILIFERRNVSEVIEEAKRNGVSQDDIDLIMPDEDAGHLPNFKTSEEVKSDDAGKCASILMMYKDDDGYVCAKRSTKYCVYQDATKIEADGFGRRLYPLAHLSWSPAKNSARGKGIVNELIPNQKIVNYILARRDMAVQKSAFPVKIVSSHVSNKEAIDQGDATLIVENYNVTNVRDMVGFVSPAAISPDAKTLNDELIDRSRDFVNAGDAAVGAINPERASGAAINAAVAQSNIPLNEINSAFIQFIEDTYMIFWDTFCAYSVNGLTAEFESIAGNLASVKIPGYLLQQMQVDIQVDVTSAQPYSKIGREQQLLGWLQSGYISFEEYIDGLEDDSIAPKSVAQKILQKRKEQQMLTGGMMNGLPQMQTGNASDGTIPVAESDGGGLALPEQAV